MLYRYGSHMPDDVSFVKVTLAEHHCFNAIVQVYKFYISLQLPVYLQDMFMLSEKVTIYVQEQSLLIYSRMRTTYGQTSLFYRGAVAQNNIDQTLYSANGLNTFKSIISYLLHSQLANWFIFELYVHVEHC